MNPCNSTKQAHQANKNTASRPRARRSQHINYLRYTTRNATLRYIAYPFGFFQVEP